MSYLVYSKIMLTFAALRTKVWKLTKKKNGSVLAVGLQKYARTDR